MIELNLTYEESKKILDLGYDFRRVSNIFVNEQGRFYNRANNYLAVARDITLYEIDQRPDLIPAFFRFIDHLTPIIPKSILQDFLLLRFKYETDYEHLITCTPLGSNKCQIVRWLSTRGTDYAAGTMEAEGSLCEAFEWLHKHYPKELKDKFNELRLDLMQ